MQGFRIIRSIKKVTVTMLVLCVVNIAILASARFGWIPINSALPMLGFVMGSQLVVMSWLGMCLWPAVQNLFFKDSGY